jgi:hypothetical protein
MRFMVTNIITGQVESDEENDREYPVKDTPWIGTQLRCYSWNTTNLPFLTVSSSKALISRPL